MRLFICDPACVQSFGHNVVALKYFRDAFKENFSDAIALCCKELDQKLAKFYDFEPFYQFYYDGYIQSPNHQPLGADKLRDCPLRYIDVLEWVATEDAVKMVSQFAISANDAVFFPHLDFYGVAGAINAFLEMPASSRPTLYLRFIGVMENASPSYRDPTPELIARIRRAKEQGLKISCSAETPRLADFLAVLLGDVVSVTPYPDFGSPMPLPSGAEFTYFCPGSARFDKGFLTLAEIFSQVRRRSQDLKIRFITQSLPYREGKHWQNYTSALYAIPGVEVCEPTISEAAMLDNYRRSSALLLPYDTTIYERRGSAAMMEGVSFCRPVITYDGSAFADQVRYYGCGLVVSSPEEMVDAIFKLAQTPRETMAIQTMQSNYRFRKDVKQSYASWLPVQS
ncbi:glycosyltransferase [Pararhizobium sp. LjRoot238]|uniref:glycosyltransferase n=1 Tax=Pararhizobium sp. LjRoot238 TaxID=3342293 RepID=UPI003ECD264D